MPGDECDSSGEQEPPRCRERIERSGHVGPSILAVIVTRARSRRDRELQVADSHRAALHNPQPRLAQQLDDVAKSQVAVAVKAAE